MEKAETAGKHGRCITLSVRVDAEEKAKLDGSAKEAGMRTASFLRTAGLRKKISAPIGKDLKDAIRTLSSNLNQLAKAYNTTKETPGVVAVEQLRDEAKRIVRAMAETQGRN